MPFTDMTPILSVRNLSTGYGKKQVLFDVSLDVMPGEILLISGGNGSGKSTLLKAIYGILSPWNTDAGISFRPGDEPSVATTPSSLNLSKGLAFVPQKAAVFDDLTVADNLRMAGHTLHSWKEFVARREEVLGWLPSLGLFLQRKPQCMSGGERQMVALGMMLLHRPRLMLLDEPTAGLDEMNAKSILNTLHELHRADEMAFIIVEHRLHECANMGGRSCRMRLGKLEINNCACDATQTLQTQS